MCGIMIDLSNMHRVESHSSIQRNSHVHLGSAASETEGIGFVKTLGRYSVPVFPA